PPGPRRVAADSAAPDAFSRVVAEAGPVDLLIHAAGVMAGTFVRQETVDAFEDILPHNPPPRSGGPPRGSPRHARGRPSDLPLLDLGPRPSPRPVRLLGLQGRPQ